jgi:hypothetical protein
MFDFCSARALVYCECSKAGGILQIENGIFCDVTSMYQVICENFAKKNVGTVFGEANFFWVAMGADRLFLVGHGGRPTFLAWTPKKSPLFLRPGFAHKFAFAHKKRRLHINSARPNLLLNMRSLYQILTHPVS